MMFMQEVLFVSQCEIFSDITTLLHSVKYFHGDRDLFHHVKYFTEAVNFSRREREISLTFQSFLTISRPGP